ncbi:MAG: nucleotidyltransferase domain-containing protein [Armatimonadia bacterium]|nr:nucleotidyltransferase domain-containing protein [Armatimonadia bacterium]
MVRVIVEHFQPRRITLFGSYARGDATPHSDVDLLLEFDECDDTRVAAVEVRKELADLAIPKDIVVTTPDQIRARAHLTWDVLHQANEEGLVLYERD